MLKTVSSVINAIGAINYQGTWDAATNTPTLTSGVGTKGDYYVVSVAGSTNLDGTTLWGVGDWAVFNGSIWQKVDGGSTGDFTNLNVSGIANFSGQLANSVMFLNASKNLATDSSFSYDGVNGRLGVGTSSPSYPLSVSASGASNTAEFRDVTGSARLRFANTGVNSAAIELNRSENALIFYALGDTAERMRITNTGNVGIGTTSPAGVLEVVGTNGVLISRSSKTASTNSGARFMGGAYTGNLATAILLDGISGENQLTLGGGTGVGEPATSIRFNTGTAGTVGAGTERMRLDASGNLGLGVTPSTWGTFKALQVGYTNIGGFTTGNNAFLSSNAYYSGSGWVYQGSYAATYYQQLTGQHIWYTAAAGTAGNTISFTQAMTLDASGRLGIGTTSPGTKLHVYQTGDATNESNSAFIIGNNAVNGIFLYSGVNNTNSYAYLGVVKAGVAYKDLVLQPNGGNLGIGTASPGARLDVNGGNANTEVRINYADNVVGRTVTLRMASTQNASYTGAGAYVQAIQGAGVDVYSLAFGTTQGSTSASERMRIDSFGNLGLGVTPSAYSVGRSLEVGTLGNGLWNVGTNDNYVVSNVYYASSAYKYAVTGTATAYRQNAGSHIWYQAASGTAGTNITFTQAMTLAASGNLMIGTTTESGSGRLRVVNAIRVADSSTETNALLTTVTATTATIETRYGTPIIFGINAAEQMRIDASGNVQIGTAAIATNATNGFFYIPTCAGTPTGTPTAKTGLAPMVIDSTNNKMYIYSGGAWVALN